MPQYSFQLRGWHAIVGVLVVFGYWGVVAYSRVRTVDDAMRASIREYLLNEYSGRSPNDVQRILAEAHNGQPIEALPEVQQRDLEFPSASAVGRFAGRYEIARVQITVDGSQPPEGDSVRYFQVQEVGIDKWVVVSQTNSYAYYLEYFPR